VASGDVTFMYFYTFTEVLAIYFLASVNVIISFTSIKWQHSLLRFSTISESSDLHSSDSWKRSRFKSYF